MSPLTIIVQNKHRGGGEGAHLSLGAGGNLEAHQKLLSSLESYEVVYDADVETDFSAAGGDWNDHLERVDIVCPI